LESEDHVAPERRTVSRQDLKEWIAKEFPSEKPDFLFDEIERKTHSAINAESFRALQADRDALQRQVESAKETIGKVELEKYEAAAKVKQYEERLKHVGDKLDPRSERTYLNIIGAFLEITTGTFKDERFTSETQLREFIAEKFDDLRGVSARNTADIFAAAKRALKDDLG
jgi:predicted  nucleic acid-binding Zn-ribbon protein